MLDGGRHRQATGHGQRATVAASQPRRQTPRGSRAGVSARAAGRTAAPSRDIDIDGRPGEIIALFGVEGSGARELLRSLAGLEQCTGSIEIDELSGSAALDKLTAYVPATRQLSLYSNFSVGENLLVRLGATGDRRARATC